MAGDEGVIWFNVLTISGKPAGLGYECEKCHLGCRHSAPEKVFHCGAWEAAPKITALLPTRQLGDGSTLPPSMVKVGTW